MSLLFQEKQQKILLGTQQEIRRFFRQKEKREKKIKIMFNYDDQRLVWK